MAAARGKRTLAIPALEDSAAFAKAIEGSDKVLVGACTPRARWGSAAQAHVPPPGWLAVLSLAPVCPPAVVDVHQSWCGPCIVMEPLFRRIFLEQDRVEDRMKIFTVRKHKQGGVVVVVVVVVAAQHVCS